MMGISRNKRRVAAPARATRAPIAGVSLAGVSLAVAAAAVLACVAVPGASAADRSGSTSWAGLFESVRPVFALDVRRVVVRLEGQSLADWTANGHGAASPAAQKAFTRQALAAQDKQLSALQAAGVQFDVRHRYIRTFNGVSLVVHGDAAALLSSAPGVVDVAPVRSVYPELYRTDGAVAPSEIAAVAPAVAPAVQAAHSAASPVSASPTSTPTVGTTAAHASRGFGSVVAILDTGIDLNHPVFAGRVAGPGYDVIAGQPGVEASDSDAHGTQVAGGVVSGAGGASVGILPVRVLSSQPALDGSDHVVGTSDDLLAGFEIAVDPNQDGATDDAANVILAAVGEPYAGFASSPEDAAVAGAATLGSVTVAAAGNDGESGDATGSVSAPAASPDAVAVGAADMRTEIRSVDIAVKGGLFDSSYRNSPLLTRVDAMPAASLPVISIDGTADDVVQYLGEDVRSRVDGAIALVSRHANVRIADQARAAEDAGAVAVLVSGAGDEAMSGVIDDANISIPVVGLGDVAAQRVTAAAASGSSVKLTTYATRNASANTVAGFSSRGARYDGSSRPDVISSGVAVATADLGRDPAGRERYSLVSGTSIAAAQVAGQAAAVTASHPTWPASTVRAALIATAHPLAGSDTAIPQGAGVPDLVAAIGVSAIGLPARVDFGIVRPGGTNSIDFERVQLAGTSALPAPRYVVEGPLDGPALSFDNGVLTVTVPDGLASGTYGGWLVDQATNLRVPYSVSVRSASELEVPLEATLSAGSFAAVDATTAGTFPTTLTLGSGGTPTGDSLGLRALQRVDIHLIDAKGVDHGAIAHLAYSLPGRYTLGISGRDAAGKPLAAGKYQLAVKYLSAAAPAGPWHNGPVTTLTITG